MKIKKVTVNLASARTDGSLVSEGTLPQGCVFKYLTVWKVGSGTFSFKFKHEDGSLSEAFNSSELAVADVFDVWFTDLIFTNTAQSGAENPIFILSW